MTELEAKIDEFIAEIGAGKYEEFFTLVSPEAANGDTIRMPYYKYTSKLHDVFDVLGEGLGQAQQPTMQERLKATEIFEAAVQGDKFSLKTLQNYCVDLRRRERFCEGAWAEALTNGSILMLLKATKQHVLNVDGPVDAKLQEPDAGLDL